MIKTFRLFTTLIAIATCIGLSASRANAQTEVGAGKPYTTLKAALDAIYAGTLTVNVVLQTTSSTAEAASAVLNASGKTCYTSVFIYPIGSDYTIYISILPPLTNLS